MICGRGGRIVLGLCLVGFTLVPAHAPAADGRAAKPATIVLGGLVPSVANVPIWLGKPLGYFAEEGVDPDIHFARGGSEVAQAVATGQATLGVTTVDPLLSAAAKGTDLGLIGVYLYFQQNIYQIAVLRESPITEIAHLKGKRIGIISFGNPSEVYAKAALREVGLDPAADATYLPTGVVEQVGVALRTGQVDAISNVDFTFVAIENAGVPLRLLPHPPRLAKLFGQVLTVRGEVLRDDRRTVVGLARAIAKATVFTMANPEAAVRLHWKMYPDQRPRNKTEVEALKDALRTLAVRDRAWSIEGASVRKWGYLDPGRWDVIVKFLGLEGKVGNPERFFTDALLDDVNRFDEGKIRGQAKAYRVTD
jgi:NitT/TauT family transport system substrate-binding protein